MTADRKTVPREPTNAMLNATFDYVSRGSLTGAATVWRAMYDAAPDLEQTKDDEHKTG